LEIPTFHTSSKKIRLEENEEGKKAMGWPRVTTSSKQPYPHLQSQNASLAPQSSRHVYLG